MTAQESEIEEKIFLSKPTYKQWTYEDINIWWEEEKKIKPWTPEQRAFYEKHTFNSK